jgi:hypothetical protein
MQVEYASPPTRANQLVYLNVSFGVDILIRKPLIDYWVEAEAFRSNRDYEIIWIIYVDNI